MKRDYSYLLGNKHGTNTGPNKTSFKKGLIPWNKNIKGIHLSPASEFKKGHKSIKTLIVGSITQRTRKRHDEVRNFIKIANPNKWKELAKHLWIKKYKKQLEVSWAQNE